MKNGSTKFFLTIIIVALLAVPSPARAAAVFFHGISDVPVMPGLTERPADEVVFDKPEGRIAEAVASGGALSASAIRAFYARTLPQLGWRAIDTGHYVRENERLAMTISAVGGLEIVRMTVTPQAAH